MSLLEKLCYPFVKLFSLNPLKHTWVHPLVLKAIHISSTKSLLPNIKNWLYLKTGRENFIKRKKPLKEPLWMIFNFSSTFFNYTPSKQFGNLTLNDPGLLKNVQASYLPSYITYYFSRDFNGKPHLSIRGSVTKEYKELIAKHVNQSLAEIAASAKETSPTENAVIDA